MQLLFILLVYAWAISLCFLIWGNFYTFIRMRRPARAPVGYPSVSILKPLRGLDPGLLENLESFLTLDYPEYEVVLSIVDPLDPAVKVVQDLLTKYPNSKARLILGGTELGANPKINNLSLPYGQARHDLLLVSDSNVRAYPRYLKDIVPHLKGNVGVVTSAIACFGAEGIGGALEEAHWNTYYSRWSYTAESLGMAFVIGKSMLFDRAVAAEFGGLLSLKDYIAEDYMLGHRMKSIRKTVALSSKPVKQFVGKKSIRDFWIRNRRWNMLQRKSEPVVFWLEPMHFSVVSGLVGAIGLYGAYSFKPLDVILATVTIWYTSDYIQSLLMGTELMLMHWLEKECIIPLIWVHSVFSSTIDWRGSKLKMLAGGKVQNSKD